MNERQTQLLAEIAQEYTKTAEPVGSKLLTEKYHKDLSSATVRNDMAVLEEEGLIAQPHTSAGRILTEHGFRELLRTVDFELHAPEREYTLIADSVSESSTPMERIKQIARNTAQLSNNAVVVAFKPNDVYYTGLSLLFRQPEFAGQAAVCSLSEMVDHLDTVMYGLSDILTKPIEVRLGKDNPFGKGCGLVVAMSKDKKIFGIVGPLRMDYQANIGRMNVVRDLINR